MALIRPEVQVWTETTDASTPRRVSTGILIGSQLVLAASYAVEPPDIVKIGIRPQGKEEIFEAKVIWSNSNETILAALVQITDPAWPRDAEVAPIRFGQVEGTGILNCYMVGYPRFTVRQAGEYFYRDTAQVTGMIAPLANARAGYLSINVTSAVPAKDEDRYSDYGSIWGGMSGAPVYSQGCLVGRVNAVRASNSLEATRIEKLANDRGFVGLAEKAIGHKLTFEKIERAESFSDTVSSVIESVATADVSNTQQIAALELALSKAYYERVLSQARSSFTAALISAGIGLLFFLAAISISLVSSNFTNTALISTISGAVVEVISGLNFWLYSRTSAQLDAFHLRLERMQRFLLANSVATSVRDLQAKDKVVANLVATIASSVIDGQSEAGLSATKPPTHNRRQSNQSRAGQL